MRLPTYWAKTERVGSSWSSGELCSPVLAAPVDQVFLMKLDSDRTRDQMDLVLAWPATRSAEEVLDAFAAAYPPGLPEDEHEYYFRMLEEIIEEAEDLSER
jgi:hypothetical protein